MNVGQGHPFPAGGAWRVHPYPEELPRYARLDDDEKPVSRFDDPQLQYRVRYVATTLRGCLVEVFQGFRRNDAVESAIAAIQTDSGRPGDLEDLDGGSLEGAGEVPGEFLRRRHAAPVAVDDNVGFFDLTDPAGWATLEVVPAVTAALERLSVAAKAVDPAAAPYRQLTVATVSLGGELGRPITQALSRAVWSGQPQPAGIRYFSQFDPAEECWAVFDHTPVTFDQTAPLDPSDPVHLAAVCGAAALHKLRLPAGWNCPS